MRERVIVGVAAALALAMLPFGTEARQPWKQAGIYVESEQGFQPLTFFVEHNPNMPTEPGTARESIPVVTTIKSFIVNMVDWEPSRLMFEYGAQQRTETVLAFSQRARSAVAIEVWSSYFKPKWIEKTWSDLLRKNAVTTDTPAYFTLTIVHKQGLAPRSYPVRLETKN